MRFIDRITADAVQKFFLTGNEDQRIVMTLRYMPSQEAWFADFELDDKTVNGVRVVDSINFLRQYHNIIPFGMSCETVNGLDPYYADDFAQQRASLYLLTAEEVDLFEREFFSD